jgi:hypothetical protein
MKWSIFCRQRDGASDVVSFKFFIHIVSYNTVIVITDELINNSDKLFVIN